MANVYDFYSDIRVIYKLGKKFKETLGTLLIDEAILGKTIRVYLDVRGLVVSVHGAEGRQLLSKLYSTQDDKYVTRINEVIDSWVNYFMENNIWNYEIICFAERGDSMYHNQLLEEKGLKSYKSSRNEQRLKDTPDDKTRRKASDYVNQQLGKLWSLYNSINSRVLFIYVNGLEIDFYPHYNISSQNDNHFNVILSKDKDLTQTLQFPNTIQIRNYKQEYLLIQQNNSIMTALKLDNNYDTKLLSLGLSILGDQSDSVCGVASLAKGGINTLFNELAEEIIQECDDGIRYDLALLRVIDREDLEVSKKVRTVINKIKNLTQTVNNVTMTNREALEFSFKMIDFNIMLDLMKVNLDAHWQPVYETFKYNYSRTDLTKRVEKSSLDRWFKSRSNYELMHLIRQGVYIL